MTRSTPLFLAQLAFTLLVAAFLVVPVVLSVTAGFTAAWPRCAMGGFGTLVPADTARTSRTDATGAAFASSRGELPRASCTRARSSACLRSVIS